MAEFLVNFDITESDCPNPEKWFPSTGSNRQDALVGALRSRKNFFPEVAYVSVGSLRQPDGNPLVVQRFSLNWGG